jgi:hypothetical protein
VSLKGGTTMDVIMQRDDSMSELEKWHDNEGKE